MRQRPRSTRRAPESAGCEAELSTPPLRRWPPLACELLPLGLERTTRSLQGRARLQGLVQSPGPARPSPGAPFDRLATVRVEGEIADVPVAGAPMPAGDGRRCLIISRQVLKTAEIDLGSEVKMRVRIDDQARWTCLNGARQRGRCTRRLKGPETRSPPARNADIASQPRRVETIGERGETVIAQVTSLAISR